MYVAFVSMIQDYKLLHRQRFQKKKGGGGGGGGE